MNLSRPEAFRLLEEKAKVTDFTNVHQYKDYADFAGFLKAMVDETERQHVDISC